METGNPFGNSTAIITCQETIRNEELKAKIILEMAHQGTTGGIHFFNSGRAIKDIQKHCDSIICLGGKGIPIDLVSRLSRSNFTPVVQVDMDGSNEVLIEGRKFKIGEMRDVARMDLLIIPSPTPYAEPIGEGFFCRELGFSDPQSVRKSGEIVARIAAIMDIPISNFLRLNNENGEIESV